MNTLTKKYIGMVEGFIPDISDVVSESTGDELRDYKAWKAGMRDSVYDIACDRIFDEERIAGNVIDHDIIRAAAKEISEYFYGKPGT